MPPHAAPSGVASPVARRGREARELEAERALRDNREARRRLETAAKEQTQDNTTESEPPPAAAEENEGE